MKLPSYKRIITNDYDDEYHDLVETLGGSINDAFNQVFFALNKRLTIGDNFQGTVRSVDVTVDANGIPTSSTRFNLDTTALSVQGLNVIRAENQTNTAIYPTSQPFVSFTQVNDSIVINHISGLQPNQRYRLRIIAYN